MKSGYQCGHTINYLWNLGLPQSMIIFVGDKGTTNYYYQFNSKQYDSYSTSNRRTQSKKTSLF